MQWELEKIYKEQVKGNIPPRKHLRVYGEGTNKDHNIADRNDIGYRDPETGQWRFERTSKEFINKVMKPNVDKYGDSASYIKQVLAHGKTANVFEETDTIDSDRVKRVYNYLINGVGRNQIKSIVGEFPKTNLQNGLIESLNQGTKFNIYDLINNKLGTNYEYNDDIMYMSPAGEEKKQRGAAGPGEAIFAFLFNGKKPEVGDLDLGGVGIELKKDEGRIGKGIITADIKSMAALFVGRGAAAAKGPGSLKPDLGEEETRRILEMNLGDFLQKYSGTGIKPAGFENTTVGDWFNENSEKSNYNSIIPLVGALQMKDYFTKVDPFTFLAIYRNTGEMSGFKRDFVEDNQIKEIVNLLKERDITFAPNNDANGYHLILKR
tara:strand:- start:43 stop:1176 length:1134 start_codon:yes stop_codon:yes gene_type:complete